MASNNADQNPRRPSDPDDQKVRVHSGTTGAKMVARGGASSLLQGGGAGGGGGGGPGSASDSFANNSPPSTHFTNFTPSTPNTASTTHDDRRHLINRDDFSGLQVVEPGLEVPHNSLPEALPPSDPEAQYVEYKGWGSQPPEAVVLPGGGWPLPEAVSPGGDNPYTPISKPYSKASSATYAGGHNPFEAEKQQQQQQQQQGGRDRKICGLRRVVFWCVLAVVVFVIVAGVAVGVGVGLGTRSDSSSSSTSSSSTSTSDISSIPSATATASATPSSLIQCPYANRTVYSLESQQDKDFLVLCGRDYNSCCGAADMLTINATTFEGCLERCGGQDGCVAVGWGNYYGVDTCWLKSAYGEPNWSGNWYAAVLVES
ncbi:hypothetical protein KVR01_008468 [Diaporthe batatas]|uniref:uncharacterized protein n=1 Tax=Diaporthe batatas TaxID=748121 RepID=UPI001D04EAD1|nr:uncharacterized protein KVR01_008468 [Diaporthe batatas]KAG8161481.1 hypothetical protein KVR01_008468 [Diaporthe batatas]